MKTAQETFDEVSAKLVAQGGPSVGAGGNCVYRGAGDRRCAAGHLIPDAEYLPEFECNILGTHSGLDAVFVRAGYDLHVLRRLQKVHDDAYDYESSQDRARLKSLSERDAVWLAGWVAGMRVVAKDLQLSTATLDKALAEREASQAGA